MFRVWNNKTKEMIYSPSLYWFKENNIPRLSKNAYFQAYNLRDDDNDYIIMPFTGELDRHSNEIYVGDIVEYYLTDEFIVTSVVRFGRYKQDGSNGMYFPTDCLGFYVEVVNYRCTSNRDYPVNFEKYYKTQNLLEQAYHCVVKGNIYENKELL